MEIHEVPFYPFDRIIDVSCFGHLRCKETNSTCVNDNTEPDIPWEKLFAEADKTVKETIQSLPEAIKAEALRVPYILEKWCPDERGLLGLYASFEPDMVSDAPGPIFLFLGEIYEECLEHDLDFGEEAKVTYLHELGHHLGLDEGGLEDRGIG